MNLTRLGFILDEVRLAPEVEVAAGFGFESLGIRTWAGLRRATVSTALRMVILLRQLERAASENQLETEAEEVVISLYN